jgi:hypothetical protein
MHRPCRLASDALARALAPTVLAARRRDDARSSAAPTSPAAAPSSAKLPAGAGGPRRRAMAAAAVRATVAMILGSWSPIAGCRALNRFVTPSSDAACLASPSNLIAFAPFA